MSDTTSGRYDPWEKHGGINGGGSRGNASAELERVRLRTHLAEFESLLEIARRGSTRQHGNLWLVPVLHRLAHLAEQMEASYCRQPGINAFENRRDFYPIGQAIRLATLGKTESDRYSPPDPFVANDLFGLLRSGGGEGGGTLVLAAVCRFFCSVAMPPADAGTRTAPPPPITSILSEELDLFDNVLSWVRGEVPPTAVNPPDTPAAAAAIERGRETVRRNKAKVEKEAKVEGSLSTGAGRISMGLGEVVVAKEEETAAREKKAARAAAAVAELRVHATGLLSAGMFSRSLNDLAVHRGLAADLVSRLREGPVADHLRAEAARGRRKQQRGTSLVTTTTAASTATAAATAVQEEGTGDGNGNGGEEVSREEGRPVRSGSGRGEGGTNAAPETLSKSEWGWGRWSSMAAAEAEHVTACVSGVGSYQEILAPLFSGDDLAVVDMLLAQPELEMRLHAVELVSALLFHKKVGMAFVRRGWMKDLLRLGAMEDATFIEPELAFCLQNFAASGGVMEAVCRVQDGSLERLLEYAATLLRSPSEATQKNILAFWEAAIRYPPALEAFEQHGALSKLLYLLLPVTPGHSEGNNGGASASGGRSRSGSFGSSRAAESQSHSPRRRRWWQIAAATSSSGSGGAGVSSGSGIGSAGARDHAEPALAQRRAEVTLRVCVCLRQYLRCSLALAVLKQTQRAGGRSAGGLMGGSGRHHHSHHNHAGRGGSSGGGSSPAAGAAATEAAPTPSTMPGRSTGRQAWGFKPLAVDDVSHAANVALVKGGGLGSVEGRLLAGGYGWIGGSALTGAGVEAPGPWGGRQGRAGGEGVAVRLGMHWPPAVQLIHHRGVQALINVVEATLTQRTMGTDTAQQALDALGTAALCPLVYPELCRPGSNSSTSDARPPPSQTPPQGGGGASASPGSIGRGGPAGRSRSDAGTASEGGNSAAATVGSDAVVVGGWTLPHNRLGVDVLLDAAGGVRQRDAGGVMCAALRVLETCCRPHRGCGPLVQQQQEQEKQPLPRTVTDTDNAGGAAAAEAEARNSARVGAPGGSDGRGGNGRRAGVDSDNRTVDDRLQRPMRKLIRERNGIRVLVGLLRYRRQAAVADAVRLRAALCLLGLAHNPQIAQMLEKMRITTTLSDTVRSGAVGRNVEAYSQLREVAKQIISRVAGRLSSTVGKSGLMDPAVTGLERAAVVANTPITFRPKELLGIIHEYLAVNGLSGAAEALAAEAELSTPSRQRHSSRRICVGASPEGNYHASSRPGGGNSRRRRVYQDGKVIRGGGGGGVDVNAPGPLTGRSTTGGNMLPARVGDKRSARGAVRRLSVAAEETVETEEGEGSRRKKRRVLSVTGEKGAPSTTVSGIPAGNTPTTADAIADPAAAINDPSEVSTAAVITPPQSSLIGRSKTAAAFASPSYFGPPRKTSFSSRAPREDRDVGTDARTVRQAASKSGGGAGGCNKTPTHSRRSPPLDSLKGGGGGEGGSTAPARGRLVSGASPSPSSSSSSASLSSRLSGTRNLPWTPSFNLAATRGKRPSRGAGTVGGGGASFVGGGSDEGKDLERQRATVGHPRGLFSGASDEQGGVDQNGGFSSGAGSGDFSLDVVRRWDHRNPATCWGDDAVAGETMLLGDGMGSGGGNGGYGMVPSGGATALDEIVTTFLLNQHERCPDPVCVLPPLSLLEPHRCPGRTPAGAMGTSAPPNIAKRAALARQAVPPLGGRGGARLQRAFVHSRFRRHRSIQDPDHVITASAFAMRPGSASRLWVGTDSGVVRLWSTFSMEVEGRWRVSQHPVINIEQHPGDRFARGGASASAPLLLSSVGFSRANDGEVLLWRALGNSVQEDPNDQEEQPLFRWSELRAARFDHGGTRVAAVLYPHSGGHSSVLAAAGQQNDRQAWGAQILDVETGSLLARLWDARSPPLYPRPNVAFNATDDLVATDGALWDPRRGTRVHQFDKLGSGCGYGLFHPNGNDVLVDEGVWDLRTHRLLRTLPSQDGALMRPSTGGEVLYTYRPLSGGDFMDMPPRGAEKDTCFGVLDASSYEQIHTYDTEKAILQLTTDEWDCDGSYISVVERDPLLSAAENVCTLYEVGRKRPDDGDSDFDDAMSEESDEEWEDAEHSDGGLDPTDDDVLGGPDWRLAESSADSDSVDLDDLIEMDSSGDDLGGQGEDGGGAGSHGRDDPGIVFRGGRPGVFGRRHGGVSRAGGERPNRRMIVVRQQLRRHLDDDDDDDDDDYEAEDNDEEDDEGGGNEEDDDEEEDDE